MLSLYLLKRRTNYFLAFIYLYLFDVNTYTLDYIYVYTTSLRVHRIKRMYLCISNFLDNFYNCISSIALTVLRPCRAYLFYEIAYYLYNIEIGLHWLIRSMNFSTNAAQSYIEPCLCTFLLLWYWISRFPLTLAHHEENARMVHRLKYGFVMAYYHTPTWC